MENEFNQEEWSAKIREASSKIDGGNPEKFNPAFNHPGTGEIMLPGEGFIKGYSCQEDMAEKKHTCYYPLPYRLAKSDVNYECTLCGKFV
jgi:hypothetical protein